LRDYIRNPGLRGVGVVQSAIIGLAIIEASKYIAGAIRDHAALQHPPREKPEEEQR
jgi:hypothetical protein